MTSQVFFPPFDAWARTTPCSILQVIPKDPHPHPVDPALNLVDHALTSYTDHLSLPAERSTHRSGDVERMEVVYEGGPSPVCNNSPSSTSTHLQLIPRHASIIATSPQPRICRRRGSSGDSERIHKRGTSLGLLPFTNTNTNTTNTTDSPIGYNTKHHKRTISTNTPEQTHRHTFSTLRTILHESNFQTNMTSSTKTVGETEFDRQRGLELVMGLMGREADLISESDEIEKKEGVGGGGGGGGCFKPARRKHKSVDATPSTPSRLASSERPSPLTWGQSRLQHRTRLSYGPGPGPGGGRLRPPPLRDLPLPSWSCPGPSPPLTALAHPFPSEFFSVHVPSPINTVCSPPPTPCSLSSTSFTLGGGGGGGGLRRRRSSLSSFESTTATIRPWDLQGEITPRPSRTQLIRLRVHEACEDVIIQRPRPRISHRTHTSFGTVGEWKKIITQSEEEARSNKKQRRTFEAFPAFEDFERLYPLETLSPSAASTAAACREEKSNDRGGRDRDRDLGSNDSATHRDVEDGRDIRSTAAWWEGLGGWLGKEKN